MLCLLRLKVYIKYVSMKKFQTILGHLYMNPVNDQGFFIFFFNYFQLPLSGRLENELIQCEIIINFIYIHLWDL